MSWILIQSWPAIVFFSISNRGKHRETFVKFSKWLIQMTFVFCFLYCNSEHIMFVNQFLKVVDEMTPSIFYVHPKTRWMYKQKKTILFILMILIFNNSKVNTCRHPKARTDRSEMRIDRWNDPLSGSVRPKIDMKAHANIIHISHPNHPCLIEEQRHTRRRAECLQ